MKVDKLPTNAVEVYENLFVTPAGDVYSRKMFKSKGERITKYKQSTKRHGYQSIMFKRKEYTVHRLVAKAFIPNALDLPIINHIDANKQNNHVSNLEWCTQSQNARHSVAIGNHIGSSHRAVIQLTLDNVFVKEHFSIADAARELGYHNQASAVASIRQNCAGKGKQFQGYRWAYA